MTVRRAGDAIFLEGVCVVEDAESLLQELQSGADFIDWSGCTHLHAACFQVILASRMPMRGQAANPEIERWLAPIIHTVEVSVCEMTNIETETHCELES